MEQNTGVATNKLWSLVSIEARKIFYAYDLWNTDIGCSKLYMLTFCWPAHFYVPQMNVLYSDGLYLKLVGVLLQKVGSYCFNNVQEYSKATVTQSESHAPPLLDHICTCLNIRDRTLVFWSNKNEFHISLDTVHKGTTHTAPPTHTVRNLH